MGFYDMNCMVTGVSLVSADATLVLLREQGDRHIPVALGISGSYDLLGKIDGFEEDLNCELLLGYFREQHRAGRFRADPDYWSPDDDFDALLGAFERTSTLSYGFEEEPCTSFDGDRLAFALIAQPVWDALAGLGAPGSAEEQFASALADEIPRGAYAGRLAELADHVAALAAVSGFLRGRAVPWAPTMSPDQLHPSDGGQHDGDEIRAWLEAAREEYHDVPELLAALDRYEEGVAELLGGEDDEDEEEDGPDPAAQAEPPPGGWAQAAFVVGSARYTVAAHDDEAETDEAETDEAETDEAETDDVR